MMHDGKVENFLHCAECGNEGFADEIFEPDTHKCSECGHDHD